MSAKNLHRTDEEGAYSHIYNKGVENRTVFNDKQDYEVFQGYLKDYLSAPQDPDSIKKDFKVHGRVFRGTPHQPKNYFNQVELIAYSLLPDHFHLLLHQITRGSLENFIRSLCTRYSIYFNKKYKHTGALFEGPYKSAQIKGEARLLHLTRYLHQTDDYSSYAEYLGTRETSWVKPNHILSLLGNRTSDYENFVEKYELDQKEKELIESIILDSGNPHLEGRDLASNTFIYSPEVHVQSFENKSIGPNLKPLQRIPEFLATAVIFLLLLGIGITNIQASTTKSPNPSPSVLSQTKETEEKPKIILTIKIDDGSGIVNIRQKPSVNSKRVGKARDGDTFELVSEDSGWYGVKLDSGSTGFISAIYITK